MQLSPFQALSAVQRPNGLPTPSSTLLIAGAGGVLGNAVLRRLVGLHRYTRTQVLASEVMAPALRQLGIHVVGADMAHWPLLRADVAVVMFDPPRMFYGRERALWVPAPEQLPVLAAWLRRCGVHTLAVVLPHAQGSLPAALQRGLASLDEHALAALGFERLLIVRSAQKPAAATHRNALHGLAAWMLGITHFMVPSSEQPIRASKIAELVDMALPLLPPGTWVAAPELVWRAAQGDAGQMRAVVREWFALP
jgi:hypothetical protein